MKTNFGYYAETVACWYLRFHGYTVICRNFHSRFGEIDIIAKKRGAYAFVEVKARSKGMVAPPAYAVDEYKQQKIIKTAYHYINRHRIPDCDMSFDVIEITKTGFKYKINHLINAFTI